MKTRTVVAATAALMVLGSVPSGASALVDSRGSTSSTRLVHAGLPGGPPVQAATTARKRPPTYHVAPGYTLTNPLDSTAHAIRTKVLRAINHTRPGAKIRMVSWNFDNFGYVGALTAAHNRGVSVRIIMARTLAEAQGAGMAYDRMRHNLQGAGNAQRRPQMRSWFRTCDHSCRGVGGSMHAKYFIFSRAGASKRIVMNTSANLTSASANVQWNEMYTVVNHPIVYNNYIKVFNQASLDRKYPYHGFTDGAITGWWYPRPGRSDLVTDMLNQVRCSGAKGAGIDGHTSIRVAQDVFNNKRGAAIARKLLALYRHGCSVKIVYSQAVGASGSIIRQMPNNHLVQDRDGDGLYDRYLHAKLLAISGHYGKNPAERIVMDGSANWSATALQSDEQGMIIERANVERAYSKYIDHIFNIHLVSHAPVEPTDPLADRRKPLDPYSKMEG